MQFFHLKIRDRKINFAFPHQITADPRCLGRLGLCQFPARTDGEKLGLLTVAKGANDPLDLVARFIGTVRGVDGCAVSALNSVGFGFVATRLGGWALGRQFAAVPDELDQGRAHDLWRRIAPLMGLAPFL